MKLIITGASGNVAVEVVRQALLSPSITSLVAVARKPIEAPEGTPEASSSKLKSVVVKDYMTYSEEVKKELAGADGCIWTVAITPSKASALPVDEVRKVNYDSAIAGFKAILEANPKPKQPFRFLYMSGAAAYDPEGPAHSQAKAQWLPKAMDDQCLMRGQTWTQIAKIAAEDTTRVDVCVAKPGLIAGAPRGIMRSAFSTVMSLAGVVPSIDVTEVAAAMLHQVVNGFEGTEGVMTNADMVKVGKEALQNGVKS